MSNMLNIFLLTFYAIIYSSLKKIAFVHKEKIITFVIHLMQCLFIVMFSFGFDFSAQINLTNP